MRKLNQKGFTIIELLVVIVIIGILVALTLPNLFSAQARGRDTDRKNELKNLQTKLETYFNDNGAYPTGTWSDIADDIGVDDPDEYTHPRGSDTYGFDSDGNSYTLTAALENDSDPDANGDGDYVLRSVN